MKKYKVGDEVTVLVNGIVDNVDEADPEQTYRVEVEREASVWVSNNRIFDPSNTKTYEDGLKDAWEMARIYSSMSAARKHEIFDDTTHQCFFENWSAADAINRYNEVTVKPGDVVHINGESNLRSKYVVLAIDNDTVIGYSYCDEAFRVHNLSLCENTMQKTGEHVDLSVLTNGGK